MRDQSRWYKHALGHFSGGGAADVQVRHDGTGRDGTKDMTRCIRDGQECRMTSSVPVSSSMSSPLHTSRIGGVDEKGEVWDDREVAGRAGRLGLRATN